MDDAIVVSALASLEQLLSWKSAGKARATSFDETWDNVPSQSSLEKLPRYSIKNWPVVEYCSQIQGYASLEKVHALAWRSCKALLIFPFFSLWL